MCVCTHHQNPKLLLNGIGQKDLILDDLMAKAVCEFGREECMMRECKQCPGKNGVIKFLQELPALEEKSVIKYKQWVTVDRCNLEDQTETVEDFINNLAAAIIKLLCHHYVSQKQSSFCNKCKESLLVNEGVLIGDFSENYLFLVQDAVQGFH